MVIDNNKTKLCYNLTPSEAESLILKNEMLEKQLQAYKEMNERNKKHRDEEMAELRKEVDREVRIKAELKKQLILTTTQWDQYSDQVNQMQERVKEDDNKAENLKMMLVQWRRVFEAISQQYVKLNRQIVELKRSDTELLAAVKERDQRNHLDQAFKSIEEISKDRDSMMQSENCDPNNSILLSRKSNNSKLPLYSDGSIRVSSKDLNNPESLFFDYMTNEQMRHVEVLSQMMEEIYDKIEDMKVEMKKIDTLSHYQLVKQPEIVDRESVPYRSDHGSEEDRKYQSAMWSMIWLEIENVKKSVENIFDDIRNNRFDELKKKLEKHDGKKTRFSEIDMENPSKRFEQDLQENKENNRMLFTQAKPTKRLKLDGW